MSTPPAGSERRWRSSTTRKEDASSWAILVTPIILKSIDIEDRYCPICREPYAEPPNKDQKPEAEQDWAVSVDMVAGMDGPKHCCGHIIGRRCLDMHLKAPGPWKNKCPLCREVWYELSTSDDVDDGDNDELEATPAEPQRRSQRIAERDAQRRSTAGPPESGRNGVSRAGRHQRSRRQNRPRRFTRELFAALDVEEGSNDVRCTLEEAKQKLQAFYGPARGPGLSANE
jgi:hypothetical protein